MIKFIFFLLLLELTKGQNSCGINCTFTYRSQTQTLTFNGNGKIFSPKMKQIAQQKMVEYKLKQKAKQSKVEL